MAARKTRQPPADFVSRQVETSHDLSESSPLPGGGETVGSARGLWLWPAVLLFAVWFAFLVTLAVLSANPVTLNRAQIRRADVVVEATVEDPATGACRIERSWPEAPQLGAVIRIANLGELGVRTSETYLLPLERKERGPGFRIVPTPPPLSKPLIYPAGDESRRQLEEILSNPETVAPTSDE